MVFLNPLASTSIKFWTLFFSGQDFLFKSLLTGCEGVTVAVDQPLPVQPSYSSVCVYPYIFLNSKVTRSQGPVRCDIR